MDNPELRHRLLAILAADAVGYSRLMAIDDRATVVALEAARGRFRAEVAASGGRIIDTAGDSVLAVFDSAVGAVTAALAVQKELAADAASLPADRRMPFRIGVHLGDVIERADGTVYGDGVNIAARLQALAEPGGVTVSAAIHGAVRGHIEANWLDAGEQDIKNIPYPVRAYRVQASPGTAPVVNDSATVATPTGHRLPAAAGHDRPTIAVLPFKVLSQDPPLGYLADGLVEDVIALLSRVAGFQLISQASSSAFGRRDDGVAAVARDLGVRYVVEGSVRPVGAQVRVATQLIETVTGRVLWSGRFEGSPEDTADLQDGIARGVISEIEPELNRAEIALIRRLRPENVDAWGCYQQAVGAVAQKGWTEEALHEARDHLRRAFALDPAFALAQAYFALVTALGKSTGVLAASASIDEEARAAAEAAINRDDGSSTVLGIAGCALSDLGQRDRGMEILHRALDIDPSNAQAHVALGTTLGLEGRIDEGIERMRYGMRISPRDRRLGFWGWALGCLLLRGKRADEALQEARSSAGRDPRLHLSRVLEAAALQQLGRGAEARAALAAARRIRPVPRLHLFALAHPEISLNLSAAHTHSDFALGQVDLDIRYGVPHWPNLVVEPLFEERIVPLASAAFIRQHRLKRAEQLLGVPLIRSNVSVVQWSDWFKAFSDKRAPDRFALRFDRAHMSLDAAAQGLGVALESTTTGSKHLAEGQLRPVLGMDKSVRVKAHFAVYPARHGKRPPVEAFLSWLHGEAAVSSASLASGSKRA